MNFEKSEIQSKFETQTKYGLSYWKLGGNEKFAPSNYRAYYLYECSELTLGHI